MSNAYPAFRPYTYNVDDGSAWYRYTAAFRKAEFDAPSGASAFFLHNNAEIGNSNQFGLKLFFTELEARAAYQRQQLAAQAGAAPPVGRFVYVHDRKESRFRYYGYETGVAQKLTDKEEDEFIPHYALKEYSGPTNLRRALRRIGLAGTIINDVTKNLGGSREIAPANTRFVLGGDLHGGNVMWWNGRLVCIDFGPHSVLTSTRGRIKQARNCFGRA